MTLLFSLPQFWSIYLRRPVLEVSRIASEICAYFKVTMPQVPDLLIRDHGVTVWASSLEGASNYLEVAEYIFRYMVAERKIGIGLG